MQVLEIRDANEHRIRTHPAHAQPPQGLSAWSEPVLPHMPFEQVWADPDLQGSLVSEIINGYSTPPQA